MKNTQHNRILALLRSYNGDWVPLPKILDLHIAQYGARIKELRNEGYQIENKLLEIVNGEKHTAFRLIETPQDELETAVKDNNEIQEKEMNLREVNKQLIFV